MAKSTNTPNVPLLDQIRALEAERDALAMQIIASRRTPAIDESDEAGAIEAGVAVEEFRLRRIAHARMVLDRRIAMLRRATQP